MIKLCSFGKNNLDNNEKWFIVRLLDNTLPGVKHVPELSPSPTLFKKYRKAFHNGQFNEKWFNDIYIPQFLKDLSKNRNAQQLIEHLCKESFSHDYTLVCYCENESLCHRSIIGGILLGMGANIDTNPEYSKYYNLYKLLDT